MPVWSQGLSSSLLPPPSEPSRQVKVRICKEGPPCAEETLMSAGAFCLLGAGLCVSTVLQNAWGESKAGAAGLRAPTVRFHLVLCVSLKQASKVGDAESELLMWLLSELCHVSLKGFLHLRVLWL